MSTSQSLCLSFGAARAAQLSESPSRTQLQAFSTRDRRGPGCVLIATTVTATVRKRIRAQPRPSASLLKSIATGKTISICTQSFHLPRASIESPLSIRSGRRILHVPHAPDARSFAAAPATWSSPQAQVSLSIIDPGSRTRLLLRKQHVHGLGPAALLALALFTALPNLPSPSGCPASALRVASGAGPGLSIQSAGHRRSSLPRFRPRAPQTQIGGLGAPRRKDRSARRHQRPEYQRVWSCPLAGLRQLGLHHSLLSGSEAGVDH